MNKINTEAGQTIPEAAVEAQGVSGRIVKPLGRYLWREFRWTLRAWFFPFTLFVTPPRLWWSKWEELTRP